MKGKNIHPEDSSLAYLSGGVHLVCILVIVLMSYKYRQLKNKKEGRENQDKGATASPTNTGLAPERQRLGVNGPSKDSNNGAEEG